MSKFRQNLQDCQIVEELSSNDGFISYRVTCPDYGPCRLLLAHPHARLAVKGEAAFFERAQSVARLELPGVATILDAGFYQERVACLLPLCEGVPLYDYTAMPGSVGDVLQLLRAVVENLAVAHTHGVCHGNLTPTLILVNEQNQPLLCDFALSQLFVLDYNSGVDPRYCSPEQVRGEIATPASDIYNLGCIFFRLLSGNPPYGGKNNFSIATRHLEGDFPTLPEPFQKCNQLLTAMVKLIPSQRSTAEDVLKGIASLMADQDLIEVSCWGPGTDSDTGFVTDVAMEPGTDDKELSSISSKVEALLRDQKFDFPEPETPVSTGEPEIVATPVSEPKNSKAGELRRYFVLLLVGIIIGMSVFLGYSYYQDSLSTAKSENGESVLDVERLDQSLKAWQDHDFKQAEQTLKTLIGEFPQDPRAYNNLAAIYAAQGGLELARKLLERGLATDKDYTTIHQNLGAVYAEMARESYGKALQLSASDQHLPIQVFSSQGLLLLQRSDDTPPPAAVATSLPDAGESDQAVAAASFQPGREDIVVPPGAATPAAADDTGMKAAAPAIVPPPEKTQPGEGLVVAEAPGSEPYQVQEFLENWAASWAAHDVERYLSFYSASFEPSGAMPRATWEAQRRRRLQVPGDIQIGLSDFEIQKTVAGEYIVEVMQAYDSPRYSDVTRKQFVLLNDGNALKIMRENALEIVR